MAKIDQYNLKASAEFPVSGTGEASQSLQLTASVASESGILTGTVTSGGTPVANATVKIFDINDNPLYHGNTNPLGLYTIPDVVKGTYKVTVAKNGYLTPDAVSATIVANRPTTLDFSLTVDPNATLCTLFGIIRQAVVFTPIAGATVNIYQVVAEEEILVATTLTNSAGQYLSPDLAAGEYIVVANKTGYLQSSSSPITLESPDIEGVDLALTVNVATNTGTISGIITDASTLLPVPGAIVALYSVTGTTEEVIRITRANQGGRYLFGNIESGDYIVKAFAQTTVS